MGHIVEIAQGKLEGLFADGVWRFSAIPFAKPPVGALRWHMPEPPVQWAGVRQANRMGPIAAQIRTPIEDMLEITDGEKSEDCLYLNLWTPGLDGAKRPVMVWIHGGAFNTGGGHVLAYRGDHLSVRGDVVVITINYRLGAFGFLNLIDATEGKLPAAGAEGLGDQIAALIWVRENISAFGGDPGNVTIFGESAGGMSVGALLSSPAARGLFHKAIAQSGAAHVGKPRELSAGIARALIGESGLSPEALLDAPTDAILKAQGAIIGNPKSFGGLPFMPTIDGTILPLRPIDGVRNGSARTIPVLTGSTRDEWNIFTVMRPKLRDMDEAKLLSFTAGVTGEDCAAGVIAAYTEGTPFERWNAIMTDHSFTAPAIRLAEAQSAHAPSYAYRFDWCSPFMGGVLGACHTLEVGFVFGTYNQQNAGQFFGSDSVARALCDAMMESWIAFARTGNPSNAHTGDWPQYKPATRQTMIFGDGPAHAVGAPHEGRRKAWDTVAEARIGPQAGL